MGSYWLIGSKMGICSSDESEADKRQSALNAGQNKEIAKTKQALPTDELAPISTLQREYLKSIFITLDADLNGFIDVAELREFDGLSEQQQAAIFVKMDKQKYRDGRVGLDEFLLYWTAAIEQTSWGEVQKQTQELVVSSLDEEMNFEDFKATGNNSDEKQEALVQELRRTKWFSNATTLFKEIDKNSDKQLSLDEYCRWVAANTDRAKKFIPTLDDTNAEAIVQSAKAGFAAMDTDNDGTLSEHEFEVGYLDGMASCFKCKDNTQRA